MNKQIIYNDLYDEYSQEYKRAYKSEKDAFQQQVDLQQEVDEYYEEYGEVDDIKEEMIIQWQNTEETYKERKRHQWTKYVNDTRGRLLDEILAYAKKNPSNLDAGLVESIERSKKLETLML